MSTSERTHRLLILLIGGAVVIFVLWGGMTLFRSRFVFTAIPARTSVRFEPNKGVWENPVFSSLQAFFTGTVEVGALGKPLPFSRGGAQLLQGQVSPLASMEEVLLGGARAIDLSRAADGSMFVLIKGVREGGAGTYEIRGFAMDGSVSTFATWDERPGDPTVLRVAGGSDGSVWLGGSAGRVGRCDKNGTPLWSAEGSTGLQGAVTDLVVDGTDRVWATDGTGLALGGLESFAPFDLFSNIREDHRQQILNGLTAMPDALRPRALVGDNGLLRAALLPRRLDVLSNGEAGLVTADAAFIFPLALQNGIRWVDTSVSTVIPLAFDQNGDVFGRQMSDGNLVHAWATGTISYTSSAIPKDARVSPSLFASGRDALFALDRAPSSTVLWTERGGNWTAEIVAASGTIPGDAASKIGADGIGNVWAILNQGGLLRIRKGSGSSQ